MADEDLTEEPVERGEHADLFRDIRRWWRADKDHCDKWREEAVEDFRMMAGKQFTSEELAYLKSNLRPAIVFNRIAPMIRAVGGYQNGQALKTTFQPREFNDDLAAQVLEAGNDWWRDESGAQYAEGDAFLDACICGMGWIETRLDYDDDPDGDPVDDRISPLEMYWDSSARRRNLSDARRIWHVRKMPLIEAREMFPDVDDAMLDASWTNIDFDDDGSPHSSDKPMYQEDENDRDGDDDDMITLCEVQWYEYENYRLAIDPESGRSGEVDDATAKMLSDAGVEVTKMRRKVFKRAFVGRDVIEVGPSPCGRHFSKQCITGFRDEIDNQFFGLVRSLKDPQRWANKWLSQALHIFNSSAKGGIVAERDITDNQREFEESWARADAVTWVKRGAMTDGKLQNKPGSTTPADLYNLLDFAIKTLPDASGINMEMIGLREANQPGVLEQQRKQAALTTVSVLFDCMKLYRKTHGDIIAHYFREYITDATLSRILSDDLLQMGAIEAFRQSLNRFDIKVVETATGPNQKELVWALMSPMWAQLPPSVQVEILKYSPLPADASEKISSMFAQELQKQEQMQNPPPDPMQEQLAQMELEASRVDIEKAKAETDLASAKAAKTASETTGEEINNRLTATKARFGVM